MRVLATLPALFDRLLDLMGLLAGLCVAFMALGVTVDIALRGLTGSGIRWMMEITEYMLFVMTMLGAPWVLRLGAHTAVDIVVAAVPPSLKRTLLIVSNMIGFFASSALFWYGLRGTIESAANGSMVYKTVIFPEWWLLAVITVSGLMLAIEFLRLIHLAWLGDPNAGQQRQATG